MQSIDPKDAIEISTSGEYVAGEVSIVDVEMIMTTQWRCPNPDCRTRWRKLGVHTGILKSCGACGARFFLRSQE
ncbi:MAG: hypothetical protein ABIP38_13750 [Steroidobacteraceae bacterium]